MSQDRRPFVALSDSRLAAHVTSGRPTWVIAGERLIWANVQAAALQGLASPAALLERRGPIAEAAIRQVGQFAGTLPNAGTPRLERLRGLGGPMGGATMCACSRVTLADGVRAVLLVALDAPRPVLPLQERVRRFIDCQPAFTGAVYAPEGPPLATSAARPDVPSSLAECAPEHLIRSALANGVAEGMGETGPLALERLGEGADTVLAVHFLHTGESTAGSSSALAHRSSVEERTTDPKSVELDHTVAAPAAAAPTAAVRRMPLRFVWQLDSECRFTSLSDDFVTIAGVPPHEFLGRTWIDIAASLVLDPECRIERALSSHDTFSSITIAWPIAQTAERLIIEMSGLPVFGRDRSFQGYRGFGVCRGLPQPSGSDSNVQRASEPPGLTRDGNPPRPDASAGGDLRPILSVVPPSKNVVPFRVAGPMRAGLSPVERTAFREIARALGARLEGDSEGEAARENPPPPPPPSRIPEVQDAAVPSAFAPGASAALRANDPNPSRADDDVRELRAILDTATDGVIVTDPEGTVLSVNRSAEALFGYDGPELVGHPLIDLFAPESRRAVADYLDGLTRNGVESVLNDGREVIGRVRQGGLIPLFMTIGRIGERGGKFCAVLRDVTQWKRAEEDLVNAKRLAEKASSAKSDFLAKISHEIRTPLNVIIGFSEVMLEERFGPIGNERYRDYLRDIHASGAHLTSLVNDLLDLSKIEAGKIELTFTSVNLNEVVQQSVALMQPQANRERTIIRTSLAPALPPVVVDARSIRQIMLNLLSNSIKFTGAGGQVIVSTAFTERAEVVLRVRDTGIGMTAEEIETAMQPFRQLTTSGRDAGGTGLGLPLTKALAEANRASFVIKSATNSGTLVEITFPANRVLAE